MMIFTEKISLFLTILTYVLLGNSLRGDLVFSVVQLFNLVQNSISYFLPLSFDYCAEIKVAINRIQKFLLLSEQEQMTSICNTTVIKDIGCVKLSYVTAGWLPPGQTLTDISLNIKPGTLCCILGKVGAGKTSLLHLLLKELPADSGKIDITGNISYASQEPWLFAGSVRDNILFGQIYLHNK